MGGYNIERLYSENLDEEMLFGNAQRGLRVYVFPKKGFSKYYAIYGTVYGQPIESLLFRERIRPL